MILATRRVLLNGRSKRLDDFCARSAYEHLVRTSNRRPVDATDRSLLLALGNEPRLSNAELGRRVGLSAPAVADRLQRMREEGVIRGWVLDVDPQALGMSVRASVRVRPGPGQLKGLIRTVERTSTITECLRVTGEDCLVATLFAASMDELSAVLDRLQLHGTTVTSIVVSEPVPLRPLPVAAPHTAGGSSSVVAAADLPEGATAHR